MLKDKVEFEISKIVGCCGSLFLKVENGKPYWSIKNLNGRDWEEITEELYLALCDYEGLEVECGFNGRF